MSTSLNIAVHILVDRFYQNELKAEKMASTVRVITNSLKIFRSLHTILFLLQTWTDRLDDENNSINKNENAGNISKKKISKIQYVTKGWTAKGINSFQKTFFPTLFIVFLFFYSLEAYFQWGDIESSEIP